MHIFPQITNGPPSAPLIKYQTSFPTLPVAATGSITTFPATGKTDETSSNLLGFHGHTNIGLFTSCLTTHTHDQSNTPNIKNKTIPEWTLNNYEKIIDTKFQLQENTSHPIPNHPDLPDKYSDQIFRGPRSTSGHARSISGHAHDHRHTPLTVASLTLTTQLHQLLDQLTFNFLTGPSAPTKNTATPQIEHPQKPTRTQTPF